MLEFLWTIPAFPFAGFLMLALLGKRFSRSGIALTGVCSVGFSMTAAILVAVKFINYSPPGHAYSQTLWTWVHIGSFKPQISFYLDALSLVMVLVVTFVGFLIHLYSTEFMAGDAGYRRFFAYMNLFVGSMLTLVLAGDMLLLYLGWEGVGLCSYLLIGFWYKDPVNGYAARKAFVITRVGDTSFAIGLFLLYSNLGTLEIQELMRKAIDNWPVGSSFAIAASALILGGAVGKSAQLPLQTWLPDAMAGPTPVSALIHAATMVTAGVYLIARTHTLFELAPLVQTAVALIGAVTLLLSAFSALTQSDIKRILAYSTISQIGYMFLALGVGAWSAAIFHFMTHAFFKALLFLAAGAVIAALHDEHNIFKMGGLRRELPLTFWTFLIGAASLSSLPLVTAGFYSKDMILYQAWSSKIWGIWLWLAGLAGALLTSIYTFRMVFIVFFGERKGVVIQRPGIRVAIPLVILAALSIVAGFVEFPGTLGNKPIFSTLMKTALPVAAFHVSTKPELLLVIIAGLVSLAGIYLAYLLFLRRRQYVSRVVQTPPGKAVQYFWFSGWGFDWIYDKLIVRPLVLISKVNKNDFIDLLYQGVIWLSQGSNRAVVRTQTGNIRFYAMGIAVGAIAILAIVVLL